MKRLAAVLAVALAVGGVSSANATDIIPGTNVVGPPSSSFVVSGNPFSGPVSATFGRSGLPTIASSVDRFIFRILQDGLGSGTISTSLAGIAGGATDLDFLDVRFSNDGGLTYVSVPRIGLGGSEFGGIDNIPIFNNVVNILEVTYRSRGNGSYGGTLTFTPAVPEPATWAMMMLGFGAVGFSMRRRSKTQVRVRYAF